MAVDQDARALERELRRIFESYGVSLVHIEGVDHVGICSTRQVGDKGGAYVPSMPSRSAAVALPTLAADILEALR
ncbi:hypothetical protein ABIF63_004814 [Bradyrhizobium japonicum]|uniref:Uncharacterized protein n=1 Tax=Bradyrhizobium japonicum TaxID=375 RepID=A0ABV2RUV7_BRAJP|nr:hypothetical protein [Bradyrhizobium japonicum]UQD96049.1 hypothetical protein JEY30_31395 [Bradyrhizobium japonicum]WLB16201.1 hypothetical protein QIH95_29670 [Bradyrhizobium japonicum]